MLNVFYDSYRILTSVYSDGAYLKRAMTDTFIEEKNRPHTTKICYGVLDKDIELEYAINYLCDKRPKQAIRTILKIAFYSIKYLGTAPYAVVDTAVELVKKLGKGGTSGFVNAILRKCIKTDIPLPTDETERLSVKYSIPIFAVKRLVRDYGKEEAEALFETQTERTAVRFNTGIDGEKYLEDRRWNFEKTPFSNTFFVKGFKRDEDFDKGVYTFQSIGSVAICDLVEGGEKLFDACSAPGGKSVNLADKFASVLSQELHSHRVELIKEYAERMGKNNVFAVAGDSSVFNPEYEGKFDAVLCDIPCSGYGVTGDNPDIKLRRTDEDIKSLVNVQRKILEACSKYVKDGGSLYYSTCSVFKAENEENCIDFLKKHSEFKEEKTNSPLCHKQMKVGSSFFPNISYGAGFYICKFKKQ